MGQEALAQVLRLLPPPHPDPRLLVDASTADDAGVFRIDRDRALVQTADFFTPIVDDPFTYGRIAATNALSDVYAMGGRPLTALNLLGMPTDRVPPEVIAAILRGGARVLRDARCTLVGGHSIRSPEPFYGLSVTGIVSPKRMITNAAARPGDFLVLTKPLGTGIVTTGLKRGLAPRPLVARAVRVMCRLNSEGADLGERRLVRAGTDVTGFGLLGHLSSLIRASGVGAELDAASVPVLHRGVWKLLEQDCVPGGTRQNLAYAANFTTFEPGIAPAMRLLLADAQTSGGLLLCVPEKHIVTVTALLASHRSLCAQVIGRIVASRRPHILVRP